MLENYTKRGKIMEILSYIFGILALIFWVASIQWKDKTKILKSQIIASIFFAIQYFLLGAMTAGYMNIVSVIRAYTYYKREEKKQENNVATLSIFIAIIAVIGLITCRDLLSCIPIAMSLVYNYITWQKNTRVIRIGFLLAAVVLLYYNFVVGAYISVIGNIFEIVSGIVSIYRFDVLKKVETNN